MFEGFNPTKGTKSERNGVVSVVCPWFPGHMGTVKTRQTHIWMCQNWEALRAHPNKTPKKKNSVGHPLEDSAPGQTGTLSGGRRRMGTVVLVVDVSQETPAKQKLNKHSLSMPNRPRTSAEPSETPLKCVVRTFVFPPMHKNIQKWMGWETTTHNCRGQLHS